MGIKTLTYPLCILATLALSSSARAGYQEDKDNRTIGFAKKALDRFKKNPKVFNGAEFTSQATAKDVEKQTAACKYSMMEYAKNFRQLSSGGKQTSQAKNVQSQHQTLSKHCSALTAAGQKHLKSLAGASDSKNLELATASLAGFQKNATLFNGTAFASTASGEDVRKHVASCRSASDGFNKSYNAQSAAGKGSSQATSVKSKGDTLGAHCAQLVNAQKKYRADKEAAKAAAKANAAASRKYCNKVLGASFDATSGSDLHKTLDTWRGARTMNDADGIQKYRKNLEKLNAVCSSHDDTESKCQSGHRLTSSETNQVYQIADICAMARNPSKALTDAVTRSVSFHSRVHSDELTESKLRSHEGWLRKTGPVDYATSFTVDKETKKELTAKAKKMFSAAGIPAPKDLSQLWATRQKHLDASKSAIDATRGDWKVEFGKCKGYTCKGASKSVKKEHKRAKVKGTFSRDWQISKNSLGVPLEKYLSIYVQFQLPGDPGCQVRQITAYEPYKGGGRYAKANKYTWGYVRFQKCQ